MPSRARTPSTASSRARSTPRELLLTCSPRQPQVATTTYCVQASPNPEYASQPGNYAHWLLAHLYPLVSGALGSAPVVPDLAGARLVIAHGGNAVLPVWSPRYDELFQVACVRGSSTQALVPQDGSGGGGGSNHWHGIGCRIHLNVSVPAYSYCRRSWWDSDALQRVARYLRTRLGLPTAVPRGSPTSTTLPGVRRRIVVLHRISKDGFRGFRGLERACDPSYPAHAIRNGALPPHAMVECTSFNMSTPLVVMARTVGAPDTLALISGHGAGLANVLFMLPGSAMAEFDAIKNAGKARNFYQYLAVAMGVRTTKVWLNITGARFCPPRVNACGAGNLNMYRASVSIPPEELDRVMHEVSRDDGQPLRDCGVLRDEEASRMFNAKPRVPGWNQLTFPLYHPR